MENKNESFSKSELEKQQYLSQFHKPGLPTAFLDHGLLIKKSGLKIVDQLKKEGLTYEDAYASLQYAYDEIKYESNFLKLN